MLHAQHWSWAPRMAPQDGPPKQIVLDKCFTQNSNLGPRHMAPRTVPQVVLVVPCRAVRSAATTLLQVGRPNRSLWMNGSRRITNFKPRHTAPGRLLKHVVLDGGLTQNPMFRTLHKASSPCPTQLILNECSMQDTNLGAHHMAPHDGPQTGGFG